MKWEEEDAAGGPKQSRIRYEDEVNEDDDDDDPSPTPSLIHRFSRSLSRSFSRSRLVTASDDSSPDGNSIPEGIYS